MQGKKPKYSWVTHVYVWIFLIALGISPVLILLADMRGAAIPVFDWMLCAIAMAAIQVAFWYAWRRCSSEQLTYLNGFLFVAAFMSTGWAYFSMVFVFPALFFVFIASVVLSMYYDITGASGNASVQFHKMVLFFHRNRMRQ